MRTRQQEGMPMPDRERETPGALVAAIRARRTLINVSRGGGATAGVGLNIVRMDATAPSSLASIVGGSCLPVGRIGSRRPLLPVDVGRLKPGGISSRASAPEVVGSRGTSTP